MASRNCPFDRDSDVSTSHSISQSGVRIVFTMDYAKGVVILGESFCNMILSKNDVEVPRDGLPRHRDQQDAALVLSQLLVKVCNTSLKRTLATCF